MTNPAPRFTRAYCDSLGLFDRGVSCLTWAYNEEKLIAGFLRRLNGLLRGAVRDYEIVVIDDGSTDRTHEIVSELAKEIPRIRLIRNPVNLNVGLSCVKAIRSARKEFLFWQTIDWAYDIAYFRAFLELLRDYDVVAGVRRAPVAISGPLIKPFVAFFHLFGLKHITRRSDTVPKAIVSLINYLLIRALFRVPLSDYQNVVFYRTKLLQSVDFEAKSSFINPEGLFKSYWKGASIKEVPISFIPRTQGKAKGTRPRAIWSSVKDILGCWLRWEILGKKPSEGAGVIHRLRPEEWDARS